MEKLSVYLHYNKDDIASEIQFKINSVLGKSDIDAVAYSVSATYKTANGVTCPAWIVWFNADLLITECVDTAEFNSRSAQRYEQIVNSLKTAELDIIC